MIIRKSIWLFAALACLALWPAQATAANAPGEIRRVAIEILEDADIQRELPSAPVKKPVKTDGPEFTMPEWLSKFILWAIIIGGGALLLFFLVSNAPSFSKGLRDVQDRDKEPNPDSVGKAQRDTGPEGLLEAADRLAGQGEYGEAIHLILLHALEGLRARREFSLRSSWTSREIMTGVSLTESARSALAFMVSAVEVSHFGGRLPSRTDYQTCRESHQRLTLETGGSV
jgi:hypothetical protein